MSASKCFDHAVDPIARVFEHVPNSPPVYQKIDQDIRPGIDHGFHIDRLLTVNFSARHQALQIGLPDMYEVLPLPRLYLERTDRG
jgi:hypothetical protein